MLQRRPYYLPRELTSVFITAVYVPPHSISQQLVAQPDSIGIAAGDFNHGNLKSVLPRFHRYVNFQTREKNTLDQVYKASTLPHMGLSDHLSLSLIPASKPLSCKQRPSMTYGLKKPLQPCRTASETQTGKFLLQGQTWRDKHQLFIYINFCAECFGGKNC